MTTSLPEPLTPADCDLKDFKFMPLDVARLRDSDMASEQTPEENWAAVLLWAASWHQVPAASMPDSDNWIAKAAGYMMRGRIDARWKEVKDGAMRGFVLCSDGRWYHPVVAEKANESWIGKLRQRHKTECSRIKKHNDRNGTAIPFPEFEVWFAAGCPVGQPLHVPRDNDDVSQGTDGDCPSDVPTKTPSKGQGEGQGQGQGQLNTKPEPPPPASTEVGAPEPAAPAPTRVGQVSILLRGYGVMVTPHILAQPQHAWISDARATDELLHLAVAEAKESNPTGRLNANYLAPIIHRLLNPPPPRKSRDDGGWRRTPAGIEAKGRELGMFARGGESHDSFAHRIQAAIDKRKGSTP